MSSQTPFLEQRDSAQIQAPAFEAKPSCHRSNKDCAGISGRPMSSPERIPDFGTHVSNVSNLSGNNSSSIFLLASCSFGTVIKEREIEGAPI